MKSHKKRNLVNWVSLAFFIIHHWPWEGLDPYPWKLGKGKVKVTAALWSLKKSWPAGSLSCCPHGKPECSSGQHGAQTACFISCERFSWSLCSDGGCCSLHREILRRTGVDSWRRARQWLFPPDRLQLLPRVSGSDPTTSAGGLWEAEVRLDLVN